MHTYWLGNLRLVLDVQLNPGLFEEWGWEPLSRLVGMLARLPLWAKLERSIAALSPHAALAVFLLPWVLLLPLKLLTLWLLTTGNSRWP